MRHLDLFSGIGGFALAAKNVGWNTIGFCEIDPWCQKILNKHWPGVPIHEDITEYRGTNGSADIITGGFPCQDISIAGKGAGIEGERSGLWSELARIISEVRPRYAVLENTSALLHRGMGRVLGDLSEIGYDAEWQIISASSVGANHRRDRAYILTYPRTKRISAIIPETIQEQSAFSWCKDVRRLEDLPERSLLYTSRLCRSANGVPAGMDRLKGLGNAIVPQVAEVIFRAIERHGIRA